MSTNNQVVISRIQHRRGRRENLPQPLRPGEIALTADTEQVWIGGDPDLSYPAGIRVYNDGSVSTAQNIVDNHIAEIKVRGTFDLPSYNSLVAFLTTSSVVTLTEDDIRWDDTYRGSILSITINNAGSGYTDGTHPLIISSSEGTAASATATITGGSVVSINVIAGGINYQPLEATITLSPAAGAGTNASFSLSATDVYGYAVYVACDPNVDPNNSIANVGSEALASPVAGLVIETYSLGAQTNVEAGHAPPNAASPRVFVDKFLVLEDQDAASHVSRLINRVNGSSPGQITGLVHTDLNIEIGSTIVSITDHNHPYDMAFFVGGTADTVDIQVGAFLVTRAVTVSATAGHLAKCETAPDATVVYPIRKNGTNVGTATFTNGNTTGTVVINANFSLAAGDILQLYAPSTTNAVIENVVVTIVGSALATV
jgi:hypothetical protein